MIAIKEPTLEEYLKQRIAMLETQKARTESYLDKSVYDARLWELRAVQRRLKQRRVES